MFNPVQTDVKTADDDESQMLMKILDLKELYSKELKNAECWSKISDDLEITVEQCKEIFTDAYSKYKSGKDSIDHFDSKLSQQLKRLEYDLDFDYCFENFSSLCRFCCKLTKGDDETRQIFDDSDEDRLNESNDLIDRIHYTLYDNILEKVDFKLSNLICKICSLKVEEFYLFKKQCDHNAQILSQVKNELDKMENRPEPYYSTLEKLLETSMTVENMMNEDEENSQVSEAGSSIAGDIEELYEDLTVVYSPGTEESSMEKKTKLPKAESETIAEKNRKTYKGKDSQCPICGKLVKGIQMHMLIHTGEKRHKCSYCSKSFTQSGQLKRHINSHLNIRNYKCPHNGCERTFVDPSSVTKHLVVHNKEERKFQCSLCGSRFNRLGALRYHEKTHRQERNHSCDICKKSFLAKYDLTKHYRTHTGEKPYACKYCDKRFSISKNAKVHLRVHTKEKPYGCNFCNLSFAYRSSMKNHLIKIHQQAAVSNAQLLQTISNDSDTNEIDSSAEATFPDGDPEEQLSIH